jgi:hypothetical protein
LDFGLWIIKLKKLTFLFTFFPSFPHSHSSFFFFPFYFFSLNLLACCLASLPHFAVSRLHLVALNCCLTALQCLVLPRHLAVPCATSNYCLVISSCYLDLLPCRLVVLHGTLNCQAASSYQVAKLPQATSSYLSLLLPCCLIASASGYLELPHTTSLPSCLTLPHYLAAITPQVPLDTPPICCFDGSLPCCLTPHQFIALLPCYLVLVGTALLPLLLQGGAKEEELGAWRSELSSN